MMRLDTAGGSRTGQDLRALVDHARRMRTLMRYVPRRYDPAIIEALALGGALTPELDRSEREARLSAAVHWMDVNDPEGKWTGRISAEGGFHFERLRSEEHTSELQSLMRISYAVFCLKKKNRTMPLRNKTYLTCITH